MNENVSKVTPKVVLVQTVFLGMKYIPKSFDSMTNQTYPNTEIVAVINSNEDGAKEYIQTHYPKVKIIDPGENIRFVRGHNLVFETIEADFFQLVNQDLWLESDYVEKMIKAFDDPKVGAVNGKIYSYDFDTKSARTKLSQDGSLKKVLDTTGIAISKSGAGRSRGQHQIDEGQFDSQLNLIAVDGAACMYRKSALESVKYQDQYFDTDFEMYWEDVDLSWRMINAGWLCKFVPDAIGYHGRTASSSPGGYKKVLAFIKFHRQMPQWIREFNYKNHIFLFIKNSPKWYWQFFARELVYQIFVLIFETSTLKILPTFLKQLPAIWKKRKVITKSRKITIEATEKLFT